MHSKTNITATSSSKLMENRSFKRISRNSRTATSSSKSWKASNNRTELSSRNIICKASNNRTQLGKRKSDNSKTRQKSRKTEASNNHSMLNINSNTENCRRMCGTSSNYKLKPTCKSINRQMMAFKRM